MASVRTRDSLGSYADIVASAQRTTGLTDLGEGATGQLAHGMELLVEDLLSAERLTGAGNYMHRAMIKSAVVGRLLAEFGWGSQPSYAEVEVKRPIFICGLPRTGTTALHRLLAADPASQGLELWLTEVPQPRPPREDWADNPIFQALQQAYSDHHVTNPEFMGIHYMDATSVEECWRILRQGGMSISYECLAYVPQYSQWLQSQDWTPAYQLHKRNLQLIGLNDSERHWVLKNPSHLVALDAIMEVYPDALIIQTHRDPTVAVASACSLAAEATAGWSEVFTGTTIGRTQLELWSRAVQQFETARAHYPSAQFVDVQYEEFVADPVGTVAGIYRAFSLEWTPQVVAAVTALDTESRQGGRRPRHTYSLADYGLSADQVREAFAR